MRGPQDERARPHARARVAACSTEDIASEMFVLHPVGYDGPSRMDD